MSFVHLHVHSEYSFLDSLLKVEDVVQFAAKHSKVACLSEHGNMSSFVNLAKACRHNNCKSIFACEIYETESEYALDNNGKRLPHYHLLLIAKNKTGLRNLFKIVSFAETEGFYRKPRISVDRIKTNQWGDGIIALTACQAGRLSRLLMSYEIDEARKWVDKLQSTFDSVFCEWQSHNTPSQFEANTRIIEFAKQHDIPHVITCDAHYLNENDAKAHSIYIQISEDRDDVSELYQGCWMQEEKDIYNTLSDFDKNDIRIGIENTQLIADMVEDNIDIGLDTGLQMPIVPIPPEFVNEDKYLRYLVYSKFNEKFGHMSEEEQQKRRDRIEEELPVLFAQHYSSYFIMNMRYLDALRKAGIPTGFGRGSAGNCLCLYLLGVTQVDSVRWQLDFSRFLNMGRISPPDVDTDVSKTKRQEAIKIAKEMFGEDKVAPISAFSTISTRVCIRDVAKVLNDDPDSPYYGQLPYVLRKELMDCIPTIKTLDEYGESQEKEIALRDLINSNPRLQKAYEQFPLLFEYCLKIEGRIRGRSKHASAILVTPKPLVDYGPLCLDKDGGVQFALEMHNAQDDLGCLKLDILGLRQISIIDDCLKYANLSWQDVDINHLNLDDKEVYEKVYIPGNCIGVFQYESSEAQQMSIDCHCDNINSVINCTAFNRPGTKAQFPEYCKNVIHPENATVIHPDLNKIFKSTGSVLLFQEQALQIFRLASFPEDQVDNARRAIGKKKIDVMESLEFQFRDGLRKRGWTEEQISQMWDLILIQSSYSFNKGHSVAYGLMSYLTAWLKTHYSIYYFTALMSNNVNDSTKMARFINDTRSWNIKVLPPNINKSNKDFTPIPEKNSILFGLLAIKGLGEKVVEEIIANQPYKSFDEFLSYGFNKTTVISLIKAGCFTVSKKEQLLDAYCRRLISRREYKEVSTIPSKAELLLKWGINADDYKEGRKVNKELLLKDYNTAKRIQFESSEKERYDKEIKAFHNKYMNDMWLSEFEMLNLFLTSDPLEFAYDKIHDFEQIETDTDAVLIGVIVGIQRKKDRRGDLFCYIQIYTPTGIREAICWASATKQYFELIKNGNCIAIYGRKTEGGNIIVNEMKLYKKWLEDKKLKHIGVNA